MNTEDLHLRSWGVIGEDYLGPAFHRKFEKGDLLYGSRRTYLKKVAIADFDGITSNTTFVLKENKDIVASGFIPFLMLSDRFTEHSVKHSKGSVNPYINFKDLAKFEFLLPPIDQQEQLAELLWAGDIVMQELIKARQRAHQVRMSCRSNLFLNRENKQLPFSELYELIKETSLPPHKGEYYLSLEHLESGEDRILGTGVPASAEANCFCFRKGDILYSKLRPYLDKAVTAPFDGVCSTELLVLRPHSTNGEYLIECLHSQEFVSYVVGSSFGTKMPRTSAAIIGEFSVPDISSLQASNFVSTQQKLKSVVTSIDRQIENTSTLNSKLINIIFN